MSAVAELAGDRIVVCAFCAHEVRLPEGVTVQQAAEIMEQEGWLVFTRETVVTYARCAKQACRDAQTHGPEQD